MRRGGARSAGVVLIRMGCPRVSVLWVVLAGFMLGSAASLLAVQSRQGARFRFVRVVSAANSLAPAAVPPHVHRKTALDKRIDKILARSDARRGSWGIQVVDLANGKLLYERDADHLFIPASNMKMFTTAAALEKLGPDYVFHTTVESDAAPDAQGRVADLYLVGRGDPNLGCAHSLTPTTARSSLRTSFFRTWRTRSRRAA